MIAIYDKFGIPGFTLDAAASPENTQAEHFYTEADNGLVSPWISWTWCNPPYSNITPWVDKALWESSTKGINSILLVPASVGSNWWYWYVHNFAHVYFLNGRITFEGAKDPYPKDCALLMYTPYVKGGYETWSWK